MTHQALTIPQFIDSMKVGRTTVYAEIGSGRLATYRVGRRRYISAHAAQDWQRRLEGQATEQRAPEQKAAS